VQDALNAFVVDTAALAKSAIGIALGILGNSVVVYLFLLFLMLAESRSIATKFQTRSNLVLQLGTYSRA
jgi:hypothetical protein